jgi:hypothetical protein
VKGWTANMNKIKESKKKSIQLLLEEIQNDIKEHEKFAQNQNVKIKEAYDSLMDLRNYYEVLRVSKMMIPQLQG